jgi:hypothetical protein
MKEQEKKRMWTPCTLSPKTQRPSKGENEGGDRHTKKGEEHAKPKGGKKRGGWKNSIEMNDAYGSCTLPR